MANDQTVDQQQLQSTIDELYRRLSELFPAQRDALRNALNTIQVGENQTLGMLAAADDLATAPVGNLSDLQRNIGLSNVVRVSSETGWIRPTLLNGWEHYGAPFELAEFRRDALGYVHIKGLIRNGNSRGAIFRLPEGFRPLRRHLHSLLLGNDGTTRVDLHADGVVWKESLNSSFVSLSDIPPFKAEK